MTMRRSTMIALMIQCIILRLVSSLKREQKFKQTENSKVHNISCSDMKADSFTFECEICQVSIYSSSSTCKLNGIDYSFRIPNLSDVCRDSSDDEKSCDGSTSSESFNVEVVEYELPSDSDNENYSSASSGSEVSHFIGIS